MTALRGRAARCAAVLVFALGGCGVMGKADTPVTLRLSPQFAASSARRDPRSVSVAMVHAGGNAAKSRYGYVDPARPGEINQARSLFWEEPPPAAVERALVAGLGTRFAAVAGASVALPADIRVLTDLDRFEEVSGQPGQAVVAFTATVIEHGRIARSGQYCASAAFAGTAPSARAQAFATALSGAVTALVQDLAADAAVSSHASC